MFVAPACTAQAPPVLVKDIWPTGSYIPRNLANVNGTLFFAANDGLNGLELWKSDGTEVGTVMVKDVGPRPWFLDPRNPRGARKRGRLDLVASQT